MKSGNLNFLKPSGPLQACNGTALPFFIQTLGIALASPAVGIAGLSFADWKLSPEHSSRSESAALFCVYVPGFRVAKVSSKLLYHRVLYQIFFPELFQGRGVYVGYTETFYFSIPEGLSYVRPDQQKVMSENHSYEWFKDFTAS